MNLEYETNPFKVVYKYNNTYHLDIYRSTETIQMN